ncbi:MAG: hypothetical protein FJ271_33760 [Planctomycetes bacterium]|nr:hypothetical protein [Planctomycetota bacterium]
MKVVALTKEGRRDVLPAETELRRLLRLVPAEKLADLSRAWDEILRLDTATECATTELKRIKNRLHQLIDSDKMGDATTNQLRRILSGEE